MIKKLLYSSTPAKFQSQFSPEEAARRLKTNVKITSLLTLFKASAVGRVTPDKVVLYWSRLFIGNSFIPIFKGKFLIENGQTYLVGSFSMHLFVKIFTTIWFGAFIFGIASALFKSIAHGIDPGQLNMVGFNLILIALGVALVWTGKWFARNDVKLLSDVIQSSINPRCRNEGQGHISSVSG
jgi:hypothetical protein